jgi:hypothetical protein
MNKCIAMKALSLVIAILFTATSIIQAAPVISRYNNQLRPTSTAKSSRLYEAELALQPFTFTVNDGASDSAYLPELKAEFDKRKTTPFKKGNRDGIYIAQYQTGLFYSLLHDIAERYGRGLDGIALLVWGGSFRSQQALGSDADIMLLYDRNKISEGEFLKYKNCVITALQAVGYSKVDMFEWYEVSDAIMAGKVSDLDKSAILGCKLIWGDKSLHGKLTREVKPLSLDESIYWAAGLRFWKKLKSSQYTERNNPNFKYSRGGLLDLLYIIRYPVYVGEASREEDTLLSFDLLRRKRYITTKQRQELLEAFDFFQLIRNTTQFLSGDSTNDLNDELADKVAAFLDFKNRQELVSEFWKHAGNVSGIAGHLEKVAFEKFGKIKGHGWLTRLRRIESDIASFSEKELKGLIGEGDGATAAFIAFYSQNPDILRRIANNSDIWVVRFCLAGNRYSPSDVLDKLARLEGMEWRDVRLWVARNASSSDNALNHIINYSLSRDIEVESAKITLARKKASPVEYSSSGEISDFSQKPYLSSIIQEVILSAA